MSCVYCYNSKERKEKPEQTLPFHIAKAGVDYFFSTNTSRHIRFYGPGEPTQELELMKKITEYARSKAGINLSTEIQTNGCFGKDVREWMLHNINIIWVSFDGMPKIQDTNRPMNSGNPSSPIIEENIKWLNDNKEDYNLTVGVRVTITDKNSHKQKEMIDYFYMLGVKHIWTDPVFPTVEHIPLYNDKKRQIAFQFDMDKYVENFVTACKYAKSKNLFWGSFLTCNFDGFTKKHCRACTPVPHFTTDGYISACDLAIFGENPYHMGCFIYGKWNEERNAFDIDESKVQQLQKRTVENIEHCQDCFAKTNCGGYCMGEVMNETGCLNGQKQITCNAIRRLLLEIGTCGSQYPYLHP